MLWDQYAKDFPQHYLEPGPFDDEVAAYLKEHTGLRILEIGGGTTGCYALRLRTERMRHAGVMFLEPHATQIPLWVESNLSWAIATKHKFDLIIARGVLNYLTPTQIRTIPRLLGPRGAFFANTFRNPPPPEGISRQGVTADGRVCRETIRYAQVAKVVEHCLVVGTEVHVHTFHYYPAHEITKWLGPKATTEEYGTNSLLVRITK